ncbi:MAG: YlmC/YmxH family sporulation protein [Oscillospiraceae bacterium]|nr:YlmC/YmxH family sporulation protein [Oscillospiraceae bacterium]MBQ3049311.1 YlmC/YmxH family sporulation protein [Oscillospiraceae bacterium]MBQ9939022.1 YlmC/YmxH family sporulation protein [Oscillospiraceae bacterium]
MNCRFSELRCKEVINVRDGIKMGYVDDIETDCCTSAVTAVIIYGKSRLFGLLGREDDLVIPWNCIEIIGEDIVLIKGEFRDPRRSKKSLGEKIKNWF